ncbi:nucleotidyltransferase domain-containing protein [Flagellimonas profundi]|uniref:Nucleotidyltransferase domain-containing protein n=1 Tax=Flagellimonas profundi TaxID=2915620 RepID=A0ABS3FEA8_9FLAO|nr:nucleotidyltransferase domain-containing protein [Allomuricauda profundi]MBO0341050.1 nucleotidyltransferase domain-containing protein [Allomuricauda profundi]
MKNYSIAIFGSSLRSDFDKYSDKDLLIVADDYETMENLTKIYSKDDWSISFYTYSKLKYLSENGSLFIKHLQKESKIIIDKDDRLKDILNEFIPKNNYEKDIKDCESYFDIIKTVPKTTLGYAWFCDSLFVGLRNYLVFKNAEDGIFEFSFIKLLKRLKEQRLINQSDINILRELRVVKRNYREEILDELPSLDFIKKVIPIAKGLGILESVKFVNSQKFQNIIEKSIIKRNFNPYQRLRLVEGYYCSQALNIPELKKIISNPQFYACKMKDNDFTLNLISEIKKRPTKMCLSNSGLSGKTKV